MEARMTANPKHPRIKDPAYLKAIRDMPCCLTGIRATDNESVVPAHVRGNLGGGMAYKPSDSRALPMLKSLHDAQHALGEERFWRRHIPREVLLSAVASWAEVRYERWKAEQL